MLWGVEQPSLSKSLNVVVIVLGVAMASFGEINFNWVGFLLQMAGIVFEALRLVLVQSLLNKDGATKMDTLTSLYYYAPVCAVSNFVLVLFTEARDFRVHDVWETGVATVTLNAGAAFALNIASVALVSTTQIPLPLSVVACTVAKMCGTPSDPRDLGRCSQPVRKPQEHPTHRLIRHHLGVPVDAPPVPRVRHFPQRPVVLLSGAGAACPRHIVDLGRGQKTAALRNKSPGGEL